MTFSRIKNLTSKNLPKILEAFTVVMNLTPSNAWFEGVSLRPCNLTLMSFQWLEKVKSKVKGK